MKRTLLPALIILSFLLISCSAEDTVPGGSGLVEATEVIVSAETGGRLIHLYFEEGDNIAPGDTVALIDTTIVSLRLKQAEASLRAVEAKRATAMIQVEQAALDDSLAQKEFKRISRLIESGSVNQQQYDQAQNAADKAALARQAAKVALKAAEAEKARIEAEIGLLGQQLADCRPLSPSSGKVLTTYMEAGELAAPGKPLLKIGRLDTVWVKIYLPPDDLTEIKLGNRAEIDPEDGREQPLKGTVTWISSEAEFTPKNVQTREARANLVYAVKVTIPNSEETLKIGMPVSVTIP